MFMAFTRRVSVVVVLISIAAVSHAQRPETFLVPPQPIVNMIDAAPIPSGVLGPARDTLALLERRNLPPLSELAAPMLRLAGSRVNPNTNGPQRTTLVHAIAFRRIADGAEVRTSVPGATLTSFGFSPDGKHFAFGATRASGIELWIADVATGRAAPIPGVQLNGLVIGDSGDNPQPCGWLADGATMMCRTIPAGRGSAPVPPPVPAGPNVQESSGSAAPVPTYEDMLKTAHDDALFDYYFTSQLAFIDTATARVTRVGRAAIFESSDASPDGRFVLVTRIKRPFSRLVPASEFPADVEVWSRQGEIVRHLADRPGADTVPIDGVVTGPRRVAWVSSLPATLAWVEALDGGDSRKTVEFRDRVVSLAAPFAGEASELTKTAYRFTNMLFARGGTVLVTETDRASRQTRTWIIDAPGSAPRKLWDRRSEDSYGNPGTPIATVRGGHELLQAGDWVYLEGRGSSPQGDRPFLDRLNVRTLATERIFRTDETSYDAEFRPLNDAGTLVLARHESPTDVPNYVVRDVKTGTHRAITAFVDPQPAMRGVRRQLITYARADGVALSGTLYLPADYRPGTRLPLVMWAYPREFGDADAAGQVTGSANRFFLVAMNATHLFLLTHGYAVLDGPTMPIVGRGETANDTYVEQLVASAQAAIDKVVDMGVADRARIGVGGHSYGAFMTANLLAHSRLFRAGFAESGAYNRTLTPFGFQNERRTFWEVPQLYAKLSPFWFAGDVKDPILLMHGEADDNSGTFPIQSERFYMALRGHGATVRYVTLPHEAHGYAGRETVLHVTAEKMAWFDRYLKAAPSAPRGTQPGP